MPLPNYQINVLSPVTGQPNIVLDAMVLDELKFSRRLDDVGVVAMTMPSTEAIRAAFELDAFIEVYRANSAGVLTLEETYLTRTVHRFIENEREMLVVGGVSLLQLLMRRIVDPDDDPLAQAGYSAKEGTAGAVIYGYCSEQIGGLASIGRRINSLTVLAPTILGSQVGARLRHDNLFKAMKDLSVKGRIDFHIRRTTGNNMELFIGLIGSDKTMTTNYPGSPWIGLNPLRGNLTNPSILNDSRDEGNMCYALGQGAGDRRVVVKVPSITVSASVFNRNEFTQDVRNVEKTDLTALHTGALAALKEKQAKYEFSFVPTGEEPGNHYHDDWDVGDWITVEWGDTIADFRIIGVELTVNSQGETIEPTVSNQYLLPGEPDPDIVVPGNLPNRATCWRGADTVTVGNPLARTIDAAQYYTHTMLSDNHNGNATSQSVFLRAGIYIFSVLGITTNISGITDWYIDGVLFTSDDWFSGGTVNNVLFTHSVTVIGDGTHRVDCVVNGKNVGSGQYRTYITKYWFKMGGD